MTRSCPIWRLKTVKIDFKNWNFQHIRCWPENEPHKFWFYSDSNYENIKSLEWDDSEGKKWSLFCRLYLFSAIRLFVIWPSWRLSRYLFLYLMNLTYSIFVHLVITIEVKIRQIFTLLLSKFILYWRNWSPLFDFDLQALHGFCPINFYSRSYDMKLWRFFYNYFITMCFNSRIQHLIFSNCFPRLFYKIRTFIQKQEMLK